MPFNPDALRGSEGPEWGEPPIGHHNAILKDSNAFTARSGRDFAKLTLQVVGGDQNGHEWDVLMTLEDGAGLRITRQQLEAIGVDLAEVNGLFALADEMRKRHDTIYEVDVDRSGQYVNTWIRREHVPELGDVPIAQPSLETVPADEAGDNDIPF